MNDGVVEAAIAGATLGAGAAIWLIAVENGSENQASS